MRRSTRVLQVAAVAVVALAAAAPAPGAEAGAAGCPAAGPAVGRPVADVDEGTYAVARVPDDPRFADQWALAARTSSAPAGIDAPSAWDVTTGDPSVTVAVVDTGVDPASSALAPNLATNPGEVGGGREANGVDDDGNGLTDDWQGWDFAAGDNAPQDTSGHGTHVAGIIGARGDDRDGTTGVAWSVGLLPLRVFDDDERASTETVARAVRYAVGRGARVVNLSLGGSGRSDALLSAICAAPDTLFVAAAGNEADDVDASPYYPCAYEPANVVCVAATDEQGGLADYSSYGATSVDLAAPGTNVLGLGLGGGLATSSGTSMAAAHVSGVAALLLSMDPGRSIAEVRQALLATELRASLRGRLVSGALDAPKALGVPSHTVWWRLRPANVWLQPPVVWVEVHVPAAGTLSVTVARRWAEPATTTVEVGRPGVRLVAVGVSRAPGIRAGLRGVAVSVRLAPRAGALRQRRPHG